MKKTKTILEVNGVVVAEFFHEPDREDELLVGGDESNKHTDSDGLVPISRYFVHECIQSAYADGVNYANEIKTYEVEVD